MRRMFLICVAAIVSAALSAQRNDIYSPSATKTVAPASVTTAPVQPVAAVSATSAPVSTASAGTAERDVDEYNRRYAYSASASSDSYQSDANTVVHDTIYLKSSSYAEGYNDASEEYEYALRMMRFHSVSVSLLLSPFYWDVWYDPWYRYPVYHYAWNGVWIYDPWYYPVYNPIYNPIYVGPAYVAPGVYVRRDTYIPDRRINAGWDRKLAGGAQRDGRYGLASSGSRTAVSSAPKTIEGARVENRTSAITSTARSNSAYAQRNRVADNAAAVKTDGKRAIGSSPRNMNSTSARSNNPSTGTYSRPSSTDRTSSGSSAVSRSSEMRSVGTTQSSTYSGSSRPTGSVGGGAAMGGGSFGGGSMGSSMGSSMGGGSMGGARGSSGFSGRGR